MSWHLQYLKYKQLSKELIAASAELNSTTEIVKSVSREFKDYQDSWLKRNDSGYIEKINQQQDEFEHRVKQRDISTTKKKKLAKSSRKSSKIFSRIYKLIAKKIHPDKFAALPDSPEIREKKEMYKKVTSGLSSSNWADVMEIAMELDIKPSNLVEVNQQIEIETKSLKELTAAAKSTFGYQFFECQDDYECKERVLKACMESFF